MDSLCVCVCVRACICALFGVCPLTGGGLLLRLLAARFDFVCGGHGGRLPAQVFGEGVSEWVREWVSDLGGSIFIFFCYRLLLPLFLLLIVHM